MAAAPQFKVYIGREYVASVKDPIDGAAILAFHHEQGNSLRIGHGKGGILWNDGFDGWASESYDLVGFKVYERLENLRARWKVQP
jgi:hypothetical protein|tara:strand:- start:258 stop:512 length:255 start_codon:yes stop_codon:yes gene_type:complete